MDGGVVRGSLDLAQSLLTEPNGDIWAIGGTRIWADALAHETLPLTRAYVTTVDLPVGGDTVAPKLDDSWQRRELADWAESSKGPRFRVDEYTRA
ncbi:dihydrofolate reductase [Kocuria atrinae]|uniref:dihydrofolate reductase n=1 Tax=Kocuria atrinae TaxID=592377 RepID=UPI0002F742BF